MHRFWRASLKVGADHIKNGTEPHKSNVERWRGWDDVEKRGEGGGKQKQSHKRFFFFCFGLFLLKR